MSRKNSLSDLLRPGNPCCGQLIERSLFLRDLQTHLESVLGAVIATHYQVQNLRDGTLIIQADTSPWAARLRFEVPKVLERLRAAPGLHKLRDIQIRIARTAHPRIIKPRRAHLSKKAATVLASAAAATSDPELRDALLRLARKGNS